MLFPLRNSKRITKKHQNSNAAMIAAVSGTSSVGDCEPIKIKLNILIPPIKIYKFDLWKNKQLTDCKHIYNEKTNWIRIKVFKL